MNNYCTNCGKSGHITKNCSEPITSCGIICFNIKNISITKIENFLYNKFIDIEEYNYKNLNFINKLNKNDKDIKFLLIQRKHSLSYIEFIRGRYNENNLDDLKVLFNLMCKSEIEKIINNDFNYLWDDLWKKTAHSKIFLKELNMSKNKFNFCKKNNLFDNLTSIYDTPEWGFPKGRRNKYEKNLDCALREFEEETNFKNYILLDRINFIEEIFKGSNNVTYKHIYYTAGSDLNNIEMVNDTYEIGDIGWYTINEVINLLRPYEITKLNIINQLYFFLTIIIKKLNNKKIDLFKQKII